MLRRIIALVRSRAGWSGVLSPELVAVAMVLGTTVALEPSVAAQTPGAPDNKRPLDAEDLAEKREGFYWAVIPLAGYSPDEGLGLGARLYGYWDGERDDPLFAYTPYRTKVYVQGYASLRGVQAHSVDWDLPYVADTAYRLRAELAFDRWTSLPYFGLGESTLTKDANYASYGLTQPNATLAIERDFAGGMVRALAGLVSSYGAPEDGADFAPLLRDDCARGIARGCTAGWTNSVKLGLVIDTRDFEPDPTSGFFAEVTTEVVARALAASWNFARGTATAQGFVPLVPDTTRLVLAMRGLVAVTAGQAPYWALPTIALADGDISGLGGLRTLRGYALNRFVGDVNALVDAELRWTVARFTIASERFHVMVVPFGDAGRVFDSLSRLTWRDWKPDGGVGLRVGWNLATIVCADFGVSPEGTALYVDFGHQF